jgi:hypothetical protein
MSRKYEYSECLKISYFYILNIFNQSNGTEILNRNRSLDATKSDHFGPEENVFEFDN